MYLSLSKNCSAKFVYTENIQLKDLRRKTFVLYTKEINLFNDKFSKHNDKLAGIIISPTEDIYSLEQITNLVYHLKIPESEFPQFIDFIHSLSNTIDNTKLELKEKQKLKINCSILQNNLEKHSAYADIVEKMISHDFEEQIKWKLLKGTESDNFIIPDFPLFKKNTVRDEEKELYSFVLILDEIFLIVVSYRNQIKNFSFHFSLPL